MFDVNKMTAPLTYNLTEVSGLYGNLSTNVAAVEDNTKMTVIGGVEKDSVKKAIIVTLMSVVFLVTVCSNLIVFAVFYKRRSSLLTISNRFILNLAAGDFLMALFVMPFALTSAWTQEWVFGNLWCQVTGVLNTLLFAACILTLLLISVDRYSAITSPLHYSMRFTTLRANLMICAVWILASLFAVPPLFGWNYIEFQKHKCLCTVRWRTQITKDKFYTIFLAVLCFIIPFVITLWVYITMFRAAQKTSARARRNSVQPELSSDDLLPREGSRRGSSQGVNSTNGLRRRSSILSRSISLFHKDDRKAAKTGMIVMSTFCICWVPYFIIIVLESTMSDPSNIPSLLEVMSIWLAFTSCALNPIVYVFRNRVIQKELRRLWKKWKCMKYRPRFRDNQRNKSVISFKDTKDRAALNGYAKKHDCMKIRSFSASSNINRTDSSSTTTSSGNEKIKKAVTISVFDEQTRDLREPGDNHNNQVTRNQRTATEESDELDTEMKTMFSTSSESSLSKSTEDSHNNATSSRTKENGVQFFIG